jgi:hypothetical protein
MTAMIGTREREILSPRMVKLNDVIILHFEAAFFILMRRSVMPIIKVL